MNRGCNGGINNMWYKKAFFKYSTSFLLILLILFLIGQIDFILKPIKNALMVIAFPLIVTLLFYYILRPLVRFMTKHGLPKVLSIIASIFIPIVLLGLLGIFAGSTIVNEFNELISSEIPRIIEISEKTITDLISSGNLDFLSTKDIIDSSYNFIEITIPALSEGIFTGISGVASIVTSLLVVPFILFYFLKDDGIFVKRIVKLFPHKYKDETLDLLVDVDHTLSSYIIGQSLVCLIIGVLMYIGYTIIGLKYTLVLALFSMVTAIIPFLGPILGVVPAFIVGLSYDAFMVVKVLIVMIIVQQLEGNLITPQIMGKRIHTHPVIIIMVILLSASLFGFVGILLAIPTYAVLKVLIKNGIEFYRVIKRENVDS